MANETPATPAQAAAPGTSEQVATPPSAATPPDQPGQGGQPEGKVVIPTEEYARLQREAARGRSAQRRKDIATRSNPAADTDGLDPNDPIQAELVKERQARINVEQRLHRALVTEKVRGILDKPEYSTLPPSTRELILRNPSVLSDADNVDEALLDVEDFVQEQVAGLKPAASQPGDVGKPVQSNPAGHETPPVVNSGSPAQASAAGLEEVSNLQGANLSRAVLRNVIKKQKYGIK